MYRLHARVWHRKDDLVLYAHSATSRALVATRVTHKIPGALQTTAVVAITPCATSDAN